MWSVNWLLLRYTFLFSSLGILFLHHCWWGVHSRFSALEIVQTTLSTDLWSSMFISWLMSFFVASEIRTSENNTVRILNIIQTWNSTWSPSLYLCVCCLPYWFINIHISCSSSKEFSKLNYNPCTELCALGTAVCWGQSPEGAHSLLIGTWWVCLQAVPTIYS